MEESKLKHIGRNSKIYNARIINPANVTIGDYSQLDDFVFIHAGGPINIGDYVHIATQVAIVGKGGATLEDRCTLSAGAKLITSSAYCHGYGASACVPLEYRKAIVGHIYIREDAWIGANAVVMPGITVGEGAVLGAGGVATKDLEPWTIYVGIPAEPIKKREKIPNERYP